MDQPKYIVIMTKEGSTIIMNVITPEQGLLCKGVAI